MELQDRFYSAPEVAQILGVTLRSLYRYIDSGKLEAFKTAGGRLRFTKESIVKFMGPTLKREPVEPRYYEEEVRQPVITRRPAPIRREPVTPEVTEEEEYQPVAPRAPFGARRPIFTPRPERQELPQEEQVEVRRPVAKPLPRATSIFGEEGNGLEGSEGLEVVRGRVEPIKKPKQRLLYASSIKDLRLLAQKIQKSCQNAHVPYALTGYAGMSLYQEMPPFSVIEVYIRLDDLSFFENALQAETVTTADDANLEFKEVGDISFWQKVSNYKGFQVAARDLLEKDLAENK